jgi:hypothetical protein
MNKAKKTFKIQTFSYPFFEIDYECEILKNHLRRRFCSNQEFFPVMER